jgi:rod shape-determining protein MreB
MIGKTPDKIAAIRPLKHAGIANLMATEMIARDIIKRLDKQYNIGKPEVIINVHVGITDLEKRAVLKLVSDTGVRRVCLIEEPLSAAIGAGLDIYTPEASMVVDLGSGVTETAVISLGKIVTSDSIKVSGDDFDQAIIDFVKKDMNIEIGKNAAERIKLSLVSTKPVIGKKLEIKGRNLITGFPKTTNVTAFQVYDTLRGLFDKILQMIKNTIERTPPELVSDIQKNGIVLTGGGACIDKMDVYLKENLKIPVRVAERPLECVILGMIKIIEDDERFKKYV